jgi:hypothetical protein
MNSDSQELTIMSKTSNTTATPIGSKDERVVDENELEETKDPMNWSNVRKWSIVMVLSGMNTLGYETTSYYQHRLISGIAFQGP